MEVDRSTKSPKKFGMVNSSSNFSFLKRVLPTEHCKIALSDLLCGDLNSGRQNQNEPPTSSEEQRNMPFRFDQSQCTLDMKEREVLARQVACKFGEIIPQLLTNMLSTESSHSQASVNELSVTVQGSAPQKQSVAETDRAGEAVNHIMSMIHPDQVLLDCSGGVSIKWNLCATKNNENDSNDWSACCLRPPELIEQSLDGPISAWPLLSWSVGCLSYWIVSGVTPFWQPSPEDIPEHITDYPPGSLSGELSVSVASVIVDLLQKDPDSRLFISSIASRVSEAVSNSMHFFPSRRRRLKKNSTGDEKGSESASVSTGDTESIRSAMDESTASPTPPISDGEVKLSSYELREENSMCVEELKQPLGSSTSEQQWAKEPQDAQCDETIQCENLSEQGASAEQVITDDDAELNDRLNYRSQSHNSGDAAIESSSAFEDRPVKSLPCSFEDIAATNAEEVPDPKGSQGNGEQHADEASGAKSMIGSPNLAFVEENETRQDTAMTSGDQEEIGNRKIADSVENGGEGTTKAVTDHSRDITEVPTKEADMGIEDAQCTKEAATDNSTGDASSKAAYDERPVKGLQQSFEDIAASHAGNDAPEPMPREVACTNSKSVQPRNLGACKTRKSIGTSLARNRKSMGMTSVSSKERNGVASSTSQTESNQEHSSRSNIRSSVVRSPIESKPTSPVNSESPPKFEKNNSKPKAERSASNKEKKKSRKVGEKVAPENKTPRKAAALSPMKKKKRKSLGTSLAQNRVPVTASSDKMSEQDTSDSSAEVHGRTKAGRAQAVVQFAEQSVSQVSKQLAEAQAARAQEKQSQVSQLRSIVEQELGEGLQSPVVKRRPGAGRKSTAGESLYAPMTGGRGKATEGKTNVQHNRKTKTRHSLSSNSRRDMTQAQKAISSVIQESYEEDDSLYGDASLSSLQNSLSELMDSFKATEDAWVDNIFTN
eukprot:gb/GECG01013591.1/.p1 GENE.gb/GECG01013591.1/~~gb/GECG01013591.1/.p1  ORF type:complete len:944 (+),score=149.56 gb/GECG01013591.1/:1-2832(+)